MLKYDAVVFDLDGTLLDTLEDIAHAMNASLRANGLPEHPIDDYRYFVGDGVETLAQRVLADGVRTPERVAQIVAGFREVYAKTWAALTKPYPGIAELLDELTRRGVRLAVLSNKPHDFTSVVVEKMLGQWRFDPALGQRPGVPKKPDPAGAHDIIRHLNIPAGRILFVGDTSVDMKTAVAAGMVPVGAEWGFRTPEELRDNGAKFLIKHPMDLLASL